MDKSQYPALKSELETDSKGLGYQGKTSQEVADLLNEVGKSGEQADNTRITADEVFAALDMEEWATATQEQKDYIDKVLVAGTITPQKSLPNIRTVITQVFGNLTTTTKNLLALTYRDASRAEALGFGHVKKWDVERAIGRVVV